MGPRAELVAAPRARALRRRLRLGLVALIFGGLLAIVGLVQRSASRQRRALASAHRRFGLPPPHMLEALVPNAHHLWNFDHVALSTYVKPSGRVNTPERLAAARAGARASGRAALSMADVYRYGLEVCVWRLSYYHSYYYY